MAQREEGRGFILKLATDLRMEEWNPSGLPCLQATMQFLSLAWRGIPGPKIAGVGGDGELGVSVEVS